MQKNKNFSWKKILSHPERKEALAGINRWISFSPFALTSLESKKIAHLTTIDPKMVQVFSLLFVNNPIFERYPQTHHAILIIAEEIQKGSYGQPIEELMRGEQEVIYSSRFLFALLSHYQAHHGGLEAEIFDSISAHPQALEWLTPIKQLSTLEFGKLLTVKKESEEEKQWTDELLTFFHITELRRIPWHQLSHLYRQALDYFHYLSSATIKLILSDSIQPEVWKKAAAYAIKLPISIDQQQAWVEIAQFLEYRAEGQALIELLTQAPANAQETLLRHWLDLQLKQHQTISDKEWRVAKAAIIALEKEKRERVVRLVGLSFAKKKDYLKALELLEFEGKEERDLLLLGIIAICTRHGDFAEAKILLGSISESETRQEAIQKLLEAMIRSDRTDEASHFIEQLPRKEERQSASRVISIALRSWQRQRRLMRSAMVHRG